MICALLPFYDEPSSMLAECVVSLAGVADHLVCLDGAYRLFPDAQACSPVEQRVAVVEAAAAAGIPLTLHHAAAPWLGEVEKRNATLALSRAAGCNEGWWLLLIDADERVSLHADCLRAVLAASDSDVAAYGFDDDPPGLRRGLYRADPSLRYVGAHYIVENARGYLWGHERFQTLMPAVDVSPWLRLEHRRDARSSERVERRLAYYRARDFAGDESPDLSALSTTDALAHGLGGAE